jgi:hypothetical protein
VIERETVERRAPCLQERHPVPPDALRAILYPDGRTLARRAMFSRLLSVRSSTTFWRSSGSCWPTWEKPRETDSAFARTLRGKLTITSGAFVSWTWWCRC